MSHADTGGSVCDRDGGKHSQGKICGHSFQHNRLAVVCFRCVKDHWIYEKFSSFSPMKIVEISYCLPELHQYNKLLNKSST